MFLEVIYQSWVGDKILGTSVIVFICQVPEWWATQISSTVHNKSLVRQKEE